jgi:hypothetical protein
LRHVDIGDIRDLSTLFLWDLYQNYQGFFVIRFCHSDLNILTNKTYIKIGIMRFGYFNNFVQQCPVRQTDTSGPKMTQKLSKNLLQINGKWFTSHATSVIFYRVSVRHRNPWNKMAIQMTKVNSWHINFRYKKWWITIINIKTKGTLCSWKKLSDFKKDCSSDQALEVQMQKLLLGKNWKSQKFSIISSRPPEKPQSTQKKNFHRIQRNLDCPKPIQFKNPQK